MGGGPVGKTLSTLLDHWRPCSKNIRSRDSPPTRQFRHAKSIAIIEKHPKSSQDQYGRAITLYPRSSEMLDQLGLADELAQEWFAYRSTASYDRDGNEVQGRGWAFMENMKDTQWDFALVLRQKYQEEIFRRSLRELGVRLETPVELVDIPVEETMSEDGYRITAVTKNWETGFEESIKCKYLVVADGERSFVRRSLEVPFEGSRARTNGCRSTALLRRICQRREFTQQSSRLHMAMCCGQHWIMEPRESALRLLPRNKRVCRVQRSSDGR